MRSRTSLALAGALLVALVPAAATAAPGPVPGTTAATAPATTTVDGGSWPGPPDGGEALPGTVLTEVAPGEEDRTDTPDPPGDLSTLVPQDGAAVDDPGDQLGWAARPLRWEPR